jgi:phage shock protein C
MKNANHERAGRDDVSAAVRRLENAIHDLVRSAGGQLSEHTVRILNETASRLERQSRGDEARSRYRFGDNFGAPTRRLYRDSERGMVGGVCAGFADYFGIETWVARCIALTGLLFMPTIVFPAYWIAYFVMERKSSGRRSGSDPDSSRRDHRSPAPEFGSRLSPRRSFRNVKADLAETELRLRRMEGHVTSNRFELQRELHRMEEGGHESR